MDMEFITIKMEAFLLVCGKMIEKMEISNKRILKEKPRTFCGSWVKG